MTCRCSEAEGGPLAALRALGRAAHLMIGLPDYERYAAHRRERHPGEPVLSRADFVRERQAARYGGGAGGFRCC
jgi:uncharacterized short protein YbdD (DUF466 family)